MSENKQALNFNTLDQLLGFQLRRAQQKLFQHFMQSMTKLDITPGQTGVLILIQNNPGISQAALARAVGVERATLGETIDFLERKGWVNRHKAEHDKRSYALDLSNTGQTFVKKLIPAIHQHEKEVCENLNPKEYKQLQSLLSKFIAN